ncbi:hypothetical protein WR25_23191 [Diploscapter pachys]|uniref:F-box domain-containing protein n=1 Tax=Diploscapter pachys TaxID=2018661 RepID=A0A2A2KMH7_9BILA|nr:hypothetical protein WR25_23191 [Diploscapter pachys]
MISRLPPEIVIITCEFLSFEELRILSRTNRRNRNIVKKNFPLAYAQPFEVEEINIETKFSKNNEYSVSVELNYDIPLEFQRFTPDDFEDPIELVGYVRKPEDRKKFKAHDERAFEVLKDFPNDYAMRVSMRDEPTPWDEYLEYYEDDLDVNEEESKVIMKIGFDFINMFAPPFTIAMLQHPNYLNTDWNLRGLDAEQFSQIPLTMVKKLSVEYGSMSLFGFLENFIMTKPAIGKWEFRKIDNKDDVWGWMIAKELLETTEDITWSMKGSGPTPPTMPLLPPLFKATTFLPLCFIVQRVFGEWGEFKIETPLQKWFLEIQHNGITKFDMHVLLAYSPDQQFCSRK